MTRILPMRQLDESKVGIVRNEKLRTEWGKRHLWCQLCGRTFGLETHHISGGWGGRSDEVANFLRLCAGPDSCHKKATDELIQLPTILAAKMLGDIEEYDPCRIMRLRREVPSVELFGAIWNEARRLMAERGMTDD